MRRSDEPLPIYDEYERWMRRQRAHERMALVLLFSFGILVGMVLAALWGTPRC
jgi:alpha/beta superfamily hydrolase